MYTVDASVWVNGFDLREPGHEITRQFLGFLRTHNRTVVLPNLVLAEVAGAISRTRGDSVLAEAFAVSLSRLPNVSLAPLDGIYAHLAQTLAARHGLRGADAVYAAVAKHSGCVLVTLDKEHLARLGGIVTTATPEEVLIDVEPIPQVESEHRQEKNDL